MDTSRKVNSNAGKTSRYMPGETAERFGSPNLAAPGAGISPNARVPAQPHGAASSAPTPSTDKSGSKPSKSKPAMSAGNALPHGGGVRTTHLPAGDMTRRRR